MANSPQTPTLAANTVTPVTFDRHYDRVEVMNVDGAAEVYFTVDGTDPGIAATGSQVLPAVITSVELEPVGNLATVVKLISAGTPKVSVRGI